MTEVNGLRLAYKGFVGGLAGGYVWAAIAMALAAVVHGDPLRPLEPLAQALVPYAGSPELAFVLGLTAVQAGGALIGMCFAYFFGRFFTTRPTLAAAAPCFAVLTWALIATGTEQRLGNGRLGLAAAPLLATVAYGLLLGAGLPLRDEVTRTPEAPAAQP
jgi:hypothetical protein